MSDKNKAGNTAKKTAAKAVTKKAAAADEAVVEKMVRVRALKTPVAVPGGTLARGGEAILDLKTAEFKEGRGEVAIVEVVEG